MKNLKLFQISQYHVFFKKGVQTSKKEKKKKKNRPESKLPVFPKTFQKLLVNIFSIL